MRRADLREWFVGTKVSAPARLVFAVLYAHTGKMRRAWPSFKTLATETGLARSTVQLAIDELEIAGDVTVIRSPGHPNVYELSTGVTDCRYTGLPTVGNGVTDSPPKGYRLSVPKELKEEKKERGAAAPPSTGAGGGTANNGALTHEDRTFLPGTGWL